jgi:hypothetical protein
VFSTRKWQQRALILNLVGTALLFYSFQATSSDFHLVTAKTHSAIAGEITHYALCVNNYTLLESDSKNGLIMGSKGCPSWEQSRPAAVVNIEHPAFEGLGFTILLLGFLIQYLAVPQPRTIQEMRDELRILKKEQALKLKVAKNETRD